MLCNLIKILHTIPMKKLRQLSPIAFLYGSEIQILIKKAGYIDNPIEVISRNGWWNLTVDELREELERHSESQE